MFYKVYLNGAQPTNSQCLAENYRDVARRLVSTGTDRLVTIR